jgi:hypothetical protein
VSFAKVGTPFSAAFTTIEKTNIAENITNLVIVNPFLLEKSICKNSANFFERSTL